MVPREFVLPREPLASPSQEEEGERPSRTVRGAWEETTKVAKLLSGQLHI